MNKVIDTTIEQLLSNPALFNNIRGIIAGDQKNTKKFVSDNLKKYKVTSVLDIGCGTGDFSESVGKNMQYTGIDISQRYITFAQNKYKSKNKEFILQDVTDPAFYKNKKYDAVLFISMIHHLSDKELALLLPIIKQLTNKIVIIADIIPDPPGFLRKGMVALDQGKYIRPREGKLKLLKKYFKIVSTEMISSRLAVQFGVICDP